MPIRIAIIEDEPATARNLQFLLQKIDTSIQVVVTLSSVEDSVDWFKANSQKIQLIFADIHLADGSVFNFLMQYQPPQPIIFVTAYDHYALQAFKNNGIDYILKPFDENELTNALNKFKHYCLKPNSSNTVQNSDRIKKLLTTKQWIAPNFRQSFLVHYKNRLIPLETSSIAWFYTEKETVYAHTFNQETYVIDDTLEKLETQINPSLFLRVNRQFIIQRKSITEVELFHNGRLLLILTPKCLEKVLISKAKVPQFKSWMNS